jgi:rubredoxin
MTCRRLAPRGTRVISETFICEMCRGVFPKEPGDEEIAIAEAEARFGAIPESERAIVCDNCYQQVEQFITEREWDGSEDR